MPSNLRTELNKLFFDWKNGDLVVQDGNQRTGFKKPRRLDAKSPELDVRWQNGSGSTDIPRFIASDAHAFYVCYSGPHGCGLQRVDRNVKNYLNGSAGALPYPES